MCFEEFCVTFARLEEPAKDQLRTASEDSWPTIPHLKQIEA